MDRRVLGRTGLSVSPVGFGAFKIGRNQRVKYAAGYELPSETDSARLLNGILDAGINLIDTAPAYGVSEERIGQALSHRRSEFVLSTKIGETFENGESRYDFSATAIERSVEQSLEKLKADAVDLLLIHSDGRDLEILNNNETVPTLQRLKQRGLTRAIGLSGKTAEGARAALEWADVLMVEYHLDDESHDTVMREAATRGVGVLVKKALASGKLPPADALRFVLRHPAVTSAVIGSLSLERMKENLRVAGEI